MISILSRSASAVAIESFPRECEQRLVAVAFLVGSDQIVAAEVRIAYNGRGAACS